MYVVDASVLVADARPEEVNHPQARALLARLAAERQPVFFPTIVLAEVAAAISRGTGRADLAQRLVLLLRRMPHYTFVSVDEELGNLAAELASEHRLRGCDAVYAALAQDRDAILITHDERQREKVPDQAQARTPDEELARLGRREIHRRLVENQW